MKQLRHRESFWVENITQDSFFFQIQRVCEKDFEGDFAKYKFEVEEVQG